MPVAAVEAPDAATAQAVERNIGTLLPGLPPDTPFFSGTENMTFPSINGLLSFIEEIYERVTGQHVEFKAVIPPARGKTPGAYLMKLTLTDEQKAELMGSRNLAYHVEPVDAADGKTQLTDDAEASDGSHGILVNENGEKLTGEYDGASDLNVLAYFGRADVTYAQYLTAEAEIDPDSGEVTGTGAHSGCDAGLNLWLGAWALMAALPPALRKRG